MTKAESSQTKAARPPRTPGLMSPSAWRDYETCPRRYWYAYVDRTAPDGPVWAGWRFGRAVHRALEAALHAVQGTRRHPNDHAGLAAARTALDDARAAEGLDDDQVREASQLVVRGLASLAVRGDQVLAVEAWLRADTPAGVGVVGRADLVVRWDNGSLGICDHKVSRRPRPASELAVDRQLALYAWMAASRWPAPGGVTASHHYPPLGETVHATLDWERVRQVVADLDTTASRIAADEFFAPTAGPHCRTCQWTVTCPDGPDQ